MNLVRSTLFGEYEPSGDINTADAIVGQDYGFRQNDPGLVNRNLAGFIYDELPDDITTILQQDSAQALEELGRSPDVITRGDPSTSTGMQLDSWEVLSRALRAMNERGLSRPIIVGQAHQIGRLTLQAIKLGMNPIIPEGLPATFDHHSEQFWTRNAGAWAVRESIGVPYLKLRGKL